MYGIGVLLLLLLIASTAFLSLETEYERPGTLAQGERYVNIYEQGEKPQWRVEPENVKGEDSPFMFEITKYAGTQPTEEHYENAWKLYNSTFEAAERNGWFNFTNATTQNYKKLNSIHWAKPEYLFDSEDLKHSKPESLVYYNKPGDNKVLAGAMFYTSGIGVEGEQIGGPLTLWHYHPHWQAEQPVCFRESMSRRLNISERDCQENATRGYRTPEMMHVWFIKHPEGQFASRMSLPQEVIQREPEKMNRSEFMEHTRQKYRKYRSP